MTEESKSASLQHPTADAAARPLALEVLTRTDDMRAHGLVAMPKHGLVSQERARQLFAEELAALREEARQQGYEMGRAEAETGAALEAQRRDEASRRESQEAESRLQEKLDGLDRLAEALRSERNGLRQNAEAELVDLMFACLAKLLGEMAPKGDLLKGLIAEAVRGFDPVEPLVVRLSIGDHALLADCGVICDPHGAASRSVRYTADPELRAGACLIEGGGVTLDAGLERQLAALAETLASVHKARGSGDAATVA